MRKKESSTVTKQRKKRRDKHSQIPFVSQMTFGELVVGLFNKAVFPFDRHLEFESKTQGTEFGELLLGLLAKSSFVYNTIQSREEGSFSIYVYTDGGEHMERVVALKVFRPTFHEEEKKLKMFFPPNCKIEIECTGYPF